jgi:hypothetical protein
MNAKAEGSNSENKYLPLSSLRQKTFLSFLNAMHVVIPDLFHRGLHLQVAADLDLEGPPVGNVLYVPLLYTLLYISVPGHSFVRLYKKLKQNTVLEI